MDFNPNEYIIKIKGKGSEKSYLPVTARVAWFRKEHPNGAISTEVLSTDPLIVKAIITGENGVFLSSSHGTAKPKADAVWSGREVEKAETAAIGRALALAGFGTQFTDDFDDAENEHLADSPKEKRTNGKSQNGNTNHGEKKTYTPITRITTVERRTTLEGKSYLAFNCEDGRKTTVWTRQLFRDAGWLDEHDWEEIKGVLRLQKAIPVKLEADGDRWKIVEVINPFDADFVQADGTMAHPETTQGSAGNGSATFRK